MVMIRKTFSQRFMEVYDTLPPVELTPEQLAEIASQIDISGKVDKETGKSLIADTEIQKIHTAGSDNQDLSGLQPKETGKGLYPDTDASKLAGIDFGAQKNSDITKAEIEAKLIGELTSHSHAGGGGGLSQQQIEGIL